ncbi:MAG: hypothetical protein JW829_03435, partial [Pirellulales bacterium]|nr:hypothetical protein [Pirellulales bacterium]
RYDAVDKALYLDSRIGADFKSFLSTATGFGSVGLVHGAPFLEIRMGKIPVKKVFVDGKEVAVTGLAIH